MEKRGAGDDEQEEGKEDEGVPQKVELTKPIEDYDISLTKATEFMTEYDPEFILEIVENYCDTRAEGEELTYERKEDAYKAKLTNPINGLQVKVEVLKMENDKFCVDFTKKRGQYIDFMNEFKKIRGHCLNDKEEE